jgi:hypothetical protein
MARPGYASRLPVGVVSIERRTNGRVMHSGIGSGRADERERPRPAAREEPPRAAVLAPPDPREQCIVHDADDRRASGSRVRRC